MERDDGLGVDSNDGETGAVTLHELSEGAHEHCPDLFVSDGGWSVSGRLGWEGVVGTA